MIKTANEDIHARIRRARAVIGAGVRLAKPELEAEGRADYAESVIENQILLYGQHLTNEGRNRLQGVLFNTSSAQPESPELRLPLTARDIVSDEEIQLNLAPVTADVEDYDPDAEVDDEEF